MDRVKKIWNFFTEVYDVIFILLALCVSLILYSLNGVQAKRDPSVYIEGVGIISTNERPYFGQPVEYIVISQQKDFWLGRNATSVEDMFGLIVLAKWPKQQWVNAFKRAICESSLDPTKVNEHKGEYYHGYFQIWDIHGKKYEFYGSKILLSGFDNVKIARSMWEKEGWTPWRDSDECFKSGPDVDGIEGPDGWDWLIKPQVHVAVISF